MTAWISPSASSALSDLPERLALIESFFAVGRMVGSPWRSAPLIAPSTHSTLEKSTPCSSLNSPRMKIAAVMV